MDTAAFIRSLQDTMACADPTATKRIVRFHHVSDYRRFLQQLSDVPAESPLKQVKQMSIIRSLSCMLPAEERLQPSRPEAIVVSRH
ncbi:hypothetical protein AB4Z21_23060 [Paenibacillus sp. MCAF20]